MQWYGVSDLFKTKNLVAEEVEVQILKKDVCILKTVKARGWPNTEVHFTILYTFVQHWKYL